MPMNIVRYYLLFLVESILRFFLKWLGSTLLAVSLLLAINVGHAEQVHSAVSQSEIDYKIDSQIHHKYPALIQLMLNTESMNDDERQFWFNQMPFMNKNQIDDLRNILAGEKKKLDSINKQIEALKAEKQRRENVKASVGMH